MPRFDRWTAEVRGGDRTQPGEVSGRMDKVLELR